MDLDIQKVKITVDLGDGTCWIYENINSIIAEDKLISLEDPNSTVHVLNIEASSVTVHKKEEEKLKYKKLMEDLKKLIVDYKENNDDQNKESNCKGNCENCENGCNGNCC